MNLIKRLNVEHRERREFGYPYAWFYYQACKVQ